MNTDQIKICFILDGEDVPVFTGPEDSLSLARSKALKASNHTGRPPEEWEIRDERGVLLPPEVLFKDSGLKSKVRLFLTLMVGAGGDNACDPLFARSYVSIEESLMQYFGRENTCHTAQPGR